MTKRSIVTVHPNYGSNSVFGVRLWKTIFNSWFDFPSIFICGEIGACSLSCCDMFTVQNLQQAIIPPHGSSTEIQAPSLSPCHLLIRTIPNMQKIYLWDTKYWLINHFIWRHLDNCNTTPYVVNWVKWSYWSSLWNSTAGRIDNFQLRLTCSFIEYKNIFWSLMAPVAIESECWWWEAQTFRLWNSRHSRNLSTCLLTESKIWRGSFTRIQAKERILEIGFRNKTCETSFMILCWRGGLNKNVTDVL